MRQYSLNQLMPQIDLIIPIRFFLLYTLKGEHRIFIATSELVYGYAGYILDFDKHMRFDVNRAMKTNEQIGEHMDDEGILCCDTNEIIQFLNKTPYYNPEGYNILKSLLKTDIDEED